MTDRQIIGRMIDAAREEAEKVFQSLRKVHDENTFFPLRFACGATSSDADAGWKIERKGKSSCRFFRSQFCGVLFIELIANAIKINKGRLKRLYLRPLSAHLSSGCFLSAASLIFFSFSSKLQKLLFLSFYTFQFVRRSYTYEVSHISMCRMR